MKLINLLYILIFSLIPVFVYSQDKFEAITKEDSAKYKINFEKIFYNSPKAERDAYAALKNMITRLETFKGKVASSSSNLLNALILNDSITVQYYFHDAYLYLRYAVNTKDIESSENESALYSEFSSRTQFLQNELMQISESDLERFIIEKPEIKAYAFEIESARRMRNHTLPVSEEERLGKISPSITGWQYELYQNILEHIDFTKIKTKDGKELNVWSQRVALMNSTDRSVREAGFKKRYADVSNQRDLFAFVLLKLVKAKNSFSQAHNFKDFPDDSYFAKYLDAAEVKNLLKTVENYSYLIKNFEKIRADHIKKITGYEDVNYWDITVGSPGNTVPRFDINGAATLITETVRPLGKKYETEMINLLNPANGRLDIVLGDNRLSGGGGVGFPGIPNVFYSHGFEGYFKDVSILIHEGGHVVHYQLMGASNVKAAYGAGPNYFSESFSIFNELLLADYLYQNEKNKSKKIFYLEQFLDVKGLEIFRGAQEALLEQSIYDSVGEDKIQNADDLDKLTLGVLSKFTIWADKHPDEYKRTWMLQHLIYEDPLYLVNYLYGSLLSLKYYEMYKKNPVEFSQKYVSMMQNGFDNIPSVLLKKFLNIDLNDPQLLNDAMKLLENKINELQLLYAE